MVRAWLPTAVGDRWIYEEEIRDGNRERPEVERWEQEDVTVAIETVPQGVLIRRKVSFLNNTVPPRRIIRASGPGESNILIHNDCVYYLGDYGWDTSLQSLDGGFRKALATGEALADVCFPLQVGKIWGDPTKGRSLWTVAGLGRKNVDDPASATAETWRLEAGLTSGDDNYVWFQKGIGITAARTLHNGTYHDERIRLLRFEPGGSGR